MDLCSWHCKCTHSYLIRQEINTKIFRYFLDICKRLKIRGYPLEFYRRFLRESTKLQRLKSQIVRFQPKRGLKRGILPLFLSDAPPPALRRRMPFGCSTLAEYAEGGREGGARPPPRRRGRAVLRPLRGGCPVCGATLAPHLGARVWAVMAWGAGGEAGEAARFGWKGAE